MPKATTPTDLTAHPSTDPAAGFTAAPGAQPLPATYEAALQELEQLVSRMESGQLALDDLLRGYQRGAALLGFCKDRLQAVEDQIQVLDDGALKSWAPEA